MTNVDLSTAVEAPKGKVPYTGIVIQGPPETNHEEKERTSEKGSQRRSKD